MPLGSGAPLHRQVQTRVFRTRVHCRGGSEGGRQLSARGIIQRLRIRLVWTLFYREESPRDIPTPRLVVHLRLAHVDIDAFSSIFIIQASDESV